MNIRKKKVILFQRLLFWSLYIFAGFLLYSKKGYLYPSLITFSRTVYPLSIFWLQTRIKKRNNFLPIDASMTTSQLWFSILPVIASIFAVILSITNTLLFIVAKIT